ncbi:MAG: hypothetical protein IT186_02060 [Acidobacteria bacterium]|nr:hypothetical protein [Acidobacteriota bacterium]
MDAMIRRATAPGPRTQEVAVGSYTGAMLGRSRAYQLKAGAIHAFVTFLPAAWALGHHVVWLAWLLFGAGILGAVATLRRIYDPRVCPVRSQLARWGSWEDVATEVDGAFEGPRLVLSGAKSTLSMADRWLVYESRAETHIIPAEEIPVYLRVGRVDVGIRQTKRSRTVISKVYDGQFQAIWLGLADGTLLDLPIAAFSKTQVETFGRITDQLERYGAGEMLGTAELKRNWQDPSYRAFRVEASARERARRADSSPS